MNAHDTDDQTRHRTYQTGHRRSADPDTAAVVVAQLAAAASARAGLAEYVLISDHTQARIQTPTNVLSFESNRKKFII